MPYGELMGFVGGLTLAYVLLEEMRDLSSLESMRPSEADGAVVVEFWRLL